MPVTPVRDLWPARCVDGLVVLSAGFLSFIVVVGAGWVPLAGLRLPLGVAPVSGCICCCPQTSLGIFLGTFARFELALSVGLLLMRCSLPCRCLSGWCHLHAESMPETGAAP